MTLIKLNCLALTLILMAGCNYKVNKQSGNDSDAMTVDENTVLTYQIVASKVFAKSCVACHSVAGGNKGGVNLESYVEVKKNLQDIRDDVASRAMPLRKTLSDNEIKIVLKWIDAGASENGEAVTTPPTDPSTPPTTPPVVAPPTTPSPIAIPTNPADITFEMVKTVLLAPKCIKCHSEAGGNKGDVNLETYAGTQPNIKDMFDDLTDKSMPKGKDKELTKEQTDIFFAWYDAGAKEFGANGPTSPVIIPPVVVPPVAAPPFVMPADPKDITFEMVYKQMYVPKCLKCHSGEDAEGDVRLDSFANAKANLAQSYDDIMNLGMPVNSELSQDQIDLFFAWHDAGATEFGANATKPEAASK